MGLNQQSVPYLQTSHALAFDHVLFQAARQVMFKPVGRAPWLQRLGFPVVELLVKAVLLRGRRGPQTGGPFSFCLPPSLQLSVLRSFIFRVARPQKLQTTPLLAGDWAASLFGLRRLFPRYLSKVCRQSHTNTHPSRDSLAFSGTLGWNACSFMPSFQQLGCPSI